MYLIKIIILLAPVAVFYMPNVNAKTVLATYEISWNRIVLGNILWEFNIEDESYKFTIELKSDGISSKLYPFYGKHISSGRIENSVFKPNHYYQIWKTKKKNRLIEINFLNNKIKNLIILPEEKKDPQYNYSDLVNPTDPVSAALDLIINDNENIVRNIFDGRRIYDLSTVQEGVKKINYNERILNANQYELLITNYKNVWKEHNKTDLKKVKIITGEVSKGLVIPLKFKITNKGLVFKINCVNHKKIS